MKTEEKQFRLDLVLGCCTMFLVVVTIYQACVSRDAVNVATAANKISQDNARRDVIKDSISSINDSTKDVKQELLFKNSRIHDSISLNEQKRSIEAQISQLKEAQKQFELMNEPFLQADAKILQFGYNLPLKAEIEVENFGKYPAKILQVETTQAPVNTDWSVPLNKKFLEQNIKDRNFFGKYISNEHPLIIRGQFDSLSLDVNNAIYSLYKNGVYTYHALGIIVYQNIVTLQKFEYSFQIQIKNGNTQYFLNRTIKIK